MSAADVALRGVSKRFGERAVLDRVDASIGSGSVVSLLGPSGSGKTTLLRCLNGLTTIDAGSIEIAGHHVTSRLEGAALDRLRADVGMVFQDYQLFPHLSVLRNLALAPEVVRKVRRAEAEKQALALLERLGLSDRAGCRPHELSGGQKQRVALARALAQEVSVLLLDEPTSALDSETRDEIVAILREVTSLRRASKPLTVVLVTHDQELAGLVSDEVWTRSSGRVETSASSEKSSEGDNVDRR